MNNGAPTKAGKLNYPETLGYYDGVSCICEIDCVMCQGACGCEACEVAYDDRERERFEDSPNNHARYM